MVTHAIPDTQPMTAAERLVAMSLILAECSVVYSDVAAINTAHRLRYSITEIGSAYFFAALDAARADQRRAA